MTYGKVIRVESPRTFPKVMLLDRVLEDNILDPAFRKLAENQFTPIVLVMDGVESKTFFEKHQRARIPQLLLRLKAAATKEDQAVMEIPDIPCKSILEITPIMIWSALIQTGYADCATIFPEGFLPTFNERNKPNGFELDRNGNRIPCFEIRFHCDVEKVESNFIASLAEGIYLNDTCMKDGGCTVFLAKTLELPC